MKCSNSSDNWINNWISHTRYGDFFSSKNKLCLGGMEIIKKCISDNENFENEKMMHICLIFYKIMPIEINTIFKNFPELFPADYDWKNSKIRWICSWSRVFWSQMISKMFETLLGSSYFDLNKFKNLRTGVFNWNQSSFENIFKIQ